MSDTIGIPWRGANPFFFSCTLTDDIAQRARILLFALFFPCSFFYLLFVCMYLSVHLEMAAFFRWFFALKFAIFPCACTPRHACGVHRLVHASDPNFTSQQIPSAKPLQLSHAWYDADGHRPLNRVMAGFLFKTIVVALRANKRLKCTSTWYLDQSSALKSF